MAMNARKDEVSTLAWWNGIQSKWTTNVIRNLVRSKIIWGKTGLLPTYEKWYILELSVCEKRAYGHFRIIKKEKTNPHLFSLLVVPLENHVLQAQYSLIGCFARGTESFSLILARFPWIYRSKL